jgi:hypothetical protein
MASDGSFLVEEFLDAIASQLDRTQDALAFKAINRPLTYAIKDFSLQLQVFVEMDADGHVRFRSSGPNETGASTISIGFTTITRPMIEENTVALATSRTPSLAEAGFAPEERRRLERLGVRNTSELRRLGSSDGVGATAVSRLTQIPVARLRQALQLGRPAVTSVRPANGSGDPAGQPGGGPGIADRLAGSPQVIRLGPDTTHIHLMGTGLAADEGRPEVRIAGVPVALAEADWDRIVVPVPRHVTDALLEVELPGGEVAHFHVERDLDNGRALAEESTDPWLGGEE